MDLNELIKSEELHVKRLNELVQKSIAEEQLLTSSLIEMESDKDLNLSQRLADQVAAFGGSWMFIATFSAFIVAWIATNTVLIVGKSYDPYPFIFLNLILSCVAALQAPIIMMSQNRQEEKDRRRGRSDFLINLKAEMEIRGLHSKIDLLLADEMKTLFKVQQSQLEMLQQIQIELKSKK